MKTGIEEAAGSQLPEIREDLLAGFDVGGTKIHIADSLGHDVVRLNTSDFPDMFAVLESYSETAGARPSVIVIGMAGPRDDETGKVKLTNTEWPAFSPFEASEKFGVKIETANDLVATARGVLLETSVDLKPLKPGTATKTGTKLVVALSTGIGVAAAVWDERSERYVVSSSEGGHASFTPHDEDEQGYLDFLRAKYPIPSIEQALSGKHGIGNLFDHFAQPLEAQSLARAVKEARQNDRPLGSVLLSFATAGIGAEKEAAADLLKKMGAMVGSALRDLVLGHKATGGVYLTGGVAEALGEYFAEQTDFSERFVGRGAVHYDLLEGVPISLVTNTHVAAIGALAIAKEL